ncbi:MAG: hypothetical protein ABIS18_09725 [Actinomycetota bacterium]
MRLAGALAVFAIGLLFVGVVALLSPGSDTPDIPSATPTSQDLTPSITSSPFAFPSDTSPAATTPTQPTVAASGSGQSQSPSPLPSPSPSAAPTVAPPPPPANPVAMTGPPAWAGWAGAVPLLLGIVMLRRLRAQP